MKTKFYYLILFAGVILIAGSFIRKDYNSNLFNAGGKGDEKKEVLVETKENPSKNYLEGVLYKSEDPKRGNFKLSFDNSNIYLRTSRDFSALIGFEVLVIINGTKDKFELVDIQSKVAKDGFLLNR